MEFPFLDIYVAKGCRDIRIMCSRASFFDVVDITDVSWYIGCANIDKRCKLANVITPILFTSVLLEGA